MSSSLAALLLVAAFFAPHQNPLSAGSFPCTTCAGQGEVSLPCTTCEGDGKAPCRDCAFDSEAAQRRMLAVMELTDPAEAKKVREAMREWERTRAKLAEALGSFERGATPGRIRCPANCRGGVSFLNPGVKCKACGGKGSLKCGNCRGKGEAKCFDCLGKRKRVVACPECSGHGVGHDPLARTTDAGACPWCADAGQRDCRACDKGGKREQDCAACAGVGTRPCPDCAGTKKAWCKKCSGTGDLGSYFAAKASSRCDACKSKGVVKCTTCQRGRVECKACAGKGRLKGTCPLCYAGKVAPCEGCWQGSERAWVVTAERLFAAERFPEATAHMAVAVERAAARNHAQLRTFEGQAKQRKEVKRKSDKDLKALRKRLAVMEKEG
jgi:hypothetical protein